ncbi:MAG: 16S rRNA (cytidine(1402)-2'-O)-methyltransferase [Clostridiales bacterium]|nr:16S rRNA (cytidine(1402)-2'-O)-methyltransferase [Clostridiales bacterium]
MAGKLIVIPTPIGNLKDITTRAIEALQSVDLIAAEDTRHTLKLLNYFEIKNSLFSYHEHNKREAGEKLINRLLKGDTIGIVTDAGMPGISDPGSDLIKEAISNGIDIEVLPGPSAFVNGLILSGLDTKEFYFIGFLDRNKKVRKKKLNEMKDLRVTLIFYEAPHRIISVLKDISEVLGNRKISLAREITKKFEEVLRGTVNEIIEILQSRSIKGEFVIVVEGNSEDEIKEEFKLTVKEDLIKKISEGISKKDAIKKIAIERDIPKKEVYREAIDIENNKNPC